MMKQPKPKPQLPEQWHIIVSQQPPPVRQEQSNLLCHDHVADNQSKGRSMDIANPTQDVHRVATHDMLVNCQCPLEMSSRSTRWAARGGLAAAGHDPASPSMAIDKELYNTNMHDMRPMVQPHMR
jgi:hypothetical protein